MLMNKTQSSGGELGLAEILAVHVNCKGQSEPGHWGQRLVLKPVTSGSGTANQTDAAKAVSLSLLD